MRAAAAPKTSPRRCARWLQDSATASRRMPAGKPSSNPDVSEHHDMTDTQAVHAPQNTETAPCGDLCIRTLAMPADTNQNGDIFGGWLLSQMDLGGGVFASKTPQSRHVPVG